MINTIRNRLLLVGLILAISTMLYFELAPHLAVAQNIRIHLGPGASRVTRIDIVLMSQGNIERQAVFAYLDGAPPAVNWRFLRENGPAMFDVSISTSSGLRQKSENVLLDSHERSIECLVDSP
jgi:hypothetical protein